MTVEPQYAPIWQLAMEQGPEAMGMMVACTYRDDPKRLGIVLARYKFISKLIAGKNRVFEIGCSDGWASRVVRQTVGSLTAIDIDAIFVENARENMSDRWPIDFQVWNPCLGGGPLAGRVYDAAYALDVLEHVPKVDEGKFLSGICEKLSKDAVFIVGMPSLNSQAFASPQSKLGHVNCKHQDELALFMSSRFANVFNFCFNDEVLHVGHPGMAHYYMCLGVGLK